MPRVRRLIQSGRTALISSPLLLLAGAFLGRPAKASRLFFFVLPEFVSVSLTARVIVRSRLARTQ
jgi:hypothetical protein